MNREEAPFVRSSGAENVDASRDRAAERKEENIVAELRLQKEKQRQDHIVALQAKTDEIRSKDNDIAQLKNKIAQLESSNVALAVEEREEKAELQRDVCDLSEKLNAFGTIQRDYEAALDTVTRLRSEIEVVRESREKYYEESRQLQQQVAELTQYLDYERENNQICHNTIRNLGFEIQRLTAEGNDWKHKYETEIERKVEKDNWVEKHKLKYVVVENTREDVEAEHLSGHEESFKRQSNMANVNRGKRPNTKDHYQQSEYDTGVSVGTDEDQPQPRKKRFDLVPCSIPRCKNCGTNFHDEDLMATECTFHRVPPQSYQVWTRLNNQETVRVNPRLRDHMFWPCCESYGRYRTKGCMVLKHHEIVYPDDDVIAEVR